MSPPGWPRDLPPAETAAFDERVVPWLLDRLPGDIRASALRRHPVALATYAMHHLDGCLVGARSAYARARVELGETLGPAILADVLAALEAEGARLLQSRRESALVLAALVGRSAASSADRGEPA